MTQLIINIEDPKAVSAIKKIISLMKGVSIAKPKRKSNYERACEDIEAGRVTEYASVEDAFKDLNILI